MEGLFSGLEPHVLLLGEELTPFTSPNHVLGVSQGGGLIKAQPEGFSHQVCRGYVVAAFPVVDLL
jgi:hypothetical protein